MRWCFTLFAIISALGLSSQDRNIKFELLFDGKILALNNPYALSGKEDSITISRLRFYISDINLMVGDNTVKLQKQHHLLDVEKENSLLIALPKDSQFNQIEFKLGVDSLTNMGGAQGGDLDPLHGMYWSWNSGYINFKLEGKSKSCPTLKHKFNFHIGGFLDAYNAIRTISIRADKRVENDFIVQLDIAKIFEHIDLKKEHTIMSPSAEAMRFADLIQTLIKGI